MKIYYDYMNLLLLLFSIQNILYIYTVIFVYRSNGISQLLFIVLISMYDSKVWKITQEIKNNHSRHRRRIYKRVLFVVCHVHFSFSILMRLCSASLLFDTLMRTGRRDYDFLLLRFFLFFIFYFSRSEHVDLV